MSSRSLNQLIFRLVGGLVLITTLTILVNVWLSTTQHAKQQLTNNLTVAESVFKQTLNSREELLFNSAKVLTDDFGFKQAVATSDAATIQSVLLNHSQRVNADIMALVSLNGFVLGSTTSELTAGDPFKRNELIVESVNNGGVSTFIFQEGKLYQTIFLTVEAPSPIAVAMIGFELNRSLLDRLKSITQLDITLLIGDEDSIGGDQSTLFTVSTLDNPNRLLRTQMGVDELSWFVMFDLQEDSYLSQSFSLDKVDNKLLKVVLSENTARLFGEFSALQLKITLIAVLCIVLSLFFGAVVSKRVAKPIRRLSKLSRKISSGDYEQTIEVGANTSEITELSEAFQSMSDNIQSREKQIRFQATHDLLTQLHNRYSMSQILMQHFSNRQQFQVVGANILGFRGINDVFGYHNGDLCLQEIANRLKTLHGECGRLNGGEFMWLPDKMVSEADILSAQKFLEQPVIVNDVVMNIRVSLGILHCPEDCKDAEQVLKRLNISLDEARSAKNIMVRYEKAFEDRYTRRLAIISELKKALNTQQSELNMVYQPKLNLRTGKVTHAEALIRWNSAALGFVPPDEFIGIAEQAGLIGGVTDWVIERSIQDAKQFLTAGIDICIAINLSAKDILNTQLLPRIDQLLFSYDVPYERLAFEITESDLVSDPKKAIKELSAFRETGFSLAIDDFGTGYSSLAYLKSLPVTELKIDKSFVLNLATQASDQQIVKTIIDLAHSFELGVIAEGVEDEPTLQLLKSWDCEYMQGYHVCRPIPVDDFIDWIISNQDKDWLSASN